jgi:DNA excision repair protein ERCC-2
VTLSVDFEKRVIHAGCRDLISESNGRLIGLGGAGLSRMWLGTELHRRIQNRHLASEEGYEAEATVRTTVSVDGWAVHLTGRADGVVRRDGRVVRVDEIKTLHFAVELTSLFANDRLEPFRRQARLYAWTLSDPEAPAEIRLVLADIVTGEERIEVVHWSAAEVEDLVRRRIQRLVNAERRRQEAIERRRHAADRVVFPHPVFRPGQEDIVDAAQSTLMAGRHLLLQAPTGLGKTSSVLFPALRTALSTGRRVFFLTAKTLQQRLAVATARAMQGEHGVFRSLQLRAKASMCANTEMVCHEEFCPWAKEYGIKLVRSGLLPQLLEADPHQDPDAVFAAARDSVVCPFEVSLDLLPEVDLVICDYNYVFDPTIGLGALVGGGALKDAFLVVDEAHNLVDRSREYYSPEIRVTDLLQALVTLVSRDNAVYRRLRELTERLAEIVRVHVRRSIGDAQDGDQVINLDPEPFGELRLEFDGAMLQYFLYKRERDLWSADDPVLEVFLALTRFHRVLGLGGREFVHLARRDRNDGDMIKIVCRDASRFIGAVLDECAGAVAMSATMEPFDFYRDLLGFDPGRTEELSVPSPFPVANRLVLNLPDVDTTWRRRAAHHDSVARWIARLAPVGRNALVLFPSYLYLRDVEGRLFAPGHRVIVQRQESSADAQAEVLEALAGSEPCIVLAVLGGIFAEGVDYPGDMLSQVVVVSPGLPQFNTERELLKQYYQEAYGHGFSYAYLIPGLTRVVQAAGRLIRSEDDRGVIILIGKRFQDSRHFRYLPTEWTGGDPESLLLEDPEFTVHRFFDEG